ncbi:hypothetical protein Tco_1572920 [Tanacetum coccineum]
MMKRVNDFVKSKEAFKNMKLPKGEHPEKGTTTQFRGSRPPLHPHRNSPPRLDAYNLRDHYQPYVPPRASNRRYDNKRHNHRRQEVNHVRLDSLTKLPSKILATELQLQLLPCPPTVAPPRKENLDRYQSPFNPNPNRAGRLFRGTVHDSASILSLQRHIGMYMSARTQGRLVYRACHDEVPNTKGNRYPVRSSRTRIRMSVVGKEGG